MAKPFRAAHIRRQGAGQYRVMDVVAKRLEHDSIDCSQRYVDINKGVLRAIFQGAVQHAEY